MNFVLDASVALSWCFEDEGGGYALAVLNALRSAEAAAASLWPLEIVNGLMIAERRGRISAAASSRFSRQLLSLPIRVDPVARRRAFDVTHALARKHALTSQDAAYLELAMRLGIPIATLESPLKSAARTEGVGVFTPG